MDLLRFAVRRTVSAIVVLFAVSVLTFLIFEAIPNGNPALRLAGRTATPATIAAVSKAYGFNKPLYDQYLKTMDQIFTGRIESYTQHVTVFSQIERGFPITLGLSLGAAVMWLIMAIVLGVIGALRAGKASDTAITSLSFLGISAPSFVVGALLLYVLAFKLGWFPNGGYVGPSSSIPSWLHHMVLPWFTLSILYVGVYAQILRSNVLDTLSEDYVRTARAKGLSRRRVMVRHVLRTSLIPIVSLFGLDFAALVGGSTIIVESVFNLNGIGQYVAMSIGELDIPPVLVATLFGAFFVVLLNAVVDVAYATLDPRIKVGSS
jgi:peptide/nickel transport system permease protein